MTNEEEKIKGESLGKTFRKDFLYGLIVVLPIVATAWLVLIVIELISGPISLIFGQSIPASLSFILSIIIITLVGLLARNIIGKAALKFLERMMNRIPIINIVYKSTKQIVNAFSFNKKSLISAVLVEYPRKGIWALGFITRNDVSGLFDADGNDFGADKCAVFMPTTPNPTSGYFIYVPKDEVTRLSLSVEESIKVLMSAGVIAPEVS